MTTTTAETLHRAANELRATVKGAASPSLVTDPEFKLAVADWLDAPGCSCPPCSCCGAGMCSDDCEPAASALAVARAYLGEQA